MSQDLPYQVLAECAARERMVKYAFIMFSDPDNKSEAAKAVHAMFSAITQRNEGNEATVYFYGVGPKCVPTEEPHVKHMPDEALRAGAVYGAGGFCASPASMNAKDQVAARAKGVPLLWVRTCI